MPNVAVGISRNIYVINNQRSVLSFMMVFMQVLMAVYQLFMPVRMLMHQIGLNQEIRVKQKIFRLAVGHDIVFLAHDDDAGGNFLHDIQILRAENKAFVFFRPLQQEIYQMPLAGRVQTCSGFIEEQHLGLQ